MFDPVFERIKSEPGYFMPQNMRVPYVGIEIYTTEGNPTPMYLDEELLEASVSTWIRQSSEAEHTSSLRILICPRRLLAASSSSLPISQSTFDDLIECWKLPNLFFRARYQRTAIACECENGLVVQSEKTWPMQYIVSINHARHTKVTTAVIMGLSVEETRELGSYLKAAVAESSQVHPLLPLVALTDLSSIAANHWRSEYDDAVFNAIKQTKNDGWLDGLEENQSPLSYELVMDELNFHDLTRTLTSLALSTSGAASFIKSQIRILSFLDTQLAKSESQYNMGFEAATKSLKEKVELLKWELESIQQQNTYFQDATQALVQTVYSLVAQRDNKLNMEVASWASRDSSDMRVIAAVTLIFLPGTFTATLFSTTFWNFSPKDASQVVSHWIWLYWVVTALLTAGVLLVWLYLSHKRSIKMKHWLGAQARKAPAKQERDYPRIPGEEMRNKSFFDAKQRYQINTHP